MSGEPLFTGIISSYEVPVENLDSATIAWRDAVASIGGVTTFAQRQATDTFILSLKSTGVWAKLLILWRNIGSFNTARAALKHPISLTSLTFPGVVSGNYVEAEGLTFPAETASAIDLNFIPSSYLSADSISVGVHYPGVNFGGAVIGCGQTGGNNLFLTLLSEDTDYPVVGVPGNSARYLAICNLASMLEVSLSGLSAGLYIGSRVSNSDLRLYRNTTQIGSGTGAPGSVPTNGMLAGTVRFDTDPVLRFVPNILSMVFVGTGLTATDIANLHNAYLTYTNALGYSNLGL
jgi:hypothetical protein